MIIIHITKIRINESAGAMGAVNVLLRNLLRLPRATPASQRKLAYGFTVRFAVYIHLGKASTPLVISRIRGGGDLHDHDVVSRAALTSDGTLSLSHAWTLAPVPYRTQSGQLFRVRAARDGLAFLPAGRSIWLVIAFSASAVDPAT